MCARANDARNYAQKTTFPLKNFSSVFFANFSYLTAVKGTVTLFTIMSTDNCNSRGSLLT